MQGIGEVWRKFISEEEEEENSKNNFADFDFLGWKGACKWYFNIYNIENVFDNINIGSENTVGQKDQTRILVKCLQYWIYVLVCIITIMF